MLCRGRADRWRSAGLAGMALMVAGAARGAPDADAAQALARSNNCFKCHSVEKKKDGPSFKTTALKYAGKPDAESVLVQHLTSGEKAKFPDGHEEDHKVVRAKDPAEVKNLAAWILIQ